MNKILPLTRRFLLAQAIAATASLTSLSAAASQKIRLGGPIFLKTDDPDELAAEHRKLGYNAAYCPDVKIGARCCVDIAGSYDPAIWYGPNPKNLSKEFFDATVENCRSIIDTVKPKRTKFTIEMMGWNLPDGPDTYLDLIKAVDRSAFGVHLDICNGVNSPVRFYQNTRFIQDCFQKLGPHIASCHAKDLKWIVELNVHFQEVIPGRGQIDYQAYLNGLAALPSEVPLMLEHLKTAEEYDEGKQYIKRVGKEIGVSFA